MANPDRLSGLDASFLSLERERRAHARRLGAHLRGRRRRPTTSSCAKIEQRLHLVPRYRQKLAFPPLVAGPAGLGRRPALQRRATTCATPRCPRPAGERRAAQPGRAAVRPAARPLQAAVGDVARRPRRRRPLRADLQDAPRARRRRLGRRHRDRAVRPRARPARARRPRRRGSRARSRAAPSLLARRAGASAPTAPLDAARGARDARRATPSARVARRPAGRSPALGGDGAPPALRGAPPSPLNVPHRPAPPLRVGRRRPRALQGDQVRARRHRQRRRARRRHRRAARAT